MVPVINSGIATFREALINTITKNIKNCDEHSLMFSNFILGPKLSVLIDYSFSKELPEFQYGGFPEISSIGYSLYLNLKNNPLEFVQGLDRLMQRSSDGLEDLEWDDIALLGLASGISTLSQEEKIKYQNWLVKIIDNAPTAEIWTFRARQFAGDLLDKRGRINVLITDTGLDSAALEICLFEMQDSTELHTLYDFQYHKNLFVELLNSKNIDVLDIEKASVRLRALEILIDMILTEAGTNHLNQAIDILESVKLKLDMIIKRRKITLLSFGIIFVLAIIITIIIFLPTHWNEIDKLVTLISVIVPILGYIVVAIFNKEISPIELIKTINKKISEKVYREFEFDINEYQELTNKDFL